MDVGRPLPWNTHGPHHHEKTAPYRRVGPGRLRCRDDPILCWMLFWLVAPPLWLLRLRRQVLRPPIQRLQSRLLRHRLLRWLLSIRRLWWLRWLRRRGHVWAGRLWSDAVLRRTGLRTRRLRRWRLPGFLACCRTGARRARDHTGSAAALWCDLASRQRSPDPKCILPSGQLHAAQHGCSRADSAAHDGRSLLLEQLIALAAMSRCPTLQPAVVFRCGLCVFRSLLFVASFL